ncbi:MAG: GGDEF domain-containing protein [Phycisphaerae bacterium]|nr:GGDEF domain-containing protein [Phycisphaerae bacterium]
MSTNPSAQRATSVGAESTMAVRATDPLFTIIVFGRAEIAARLRADARHRVVLVESAFDTLGELGFAEPAQHPPVLMLETTDLLPQEVESLSAAAQRIEPAVRIVGVGSPLRIDGVDAWVDPNGTAAEWRSAMLGADAERPRLAAETAPPAGTADDSPERWDQDGAPLNALLTGRDVLGSILARVRRAFAPHEIRLQPITNGGADGSDAESSASEARVPIQHRGRTLGWLIGPAMIREQLVPAARWLALWLAVQEQHTSLKTAALTDALTGAWNRRYFDRFMESILARAKRKRNDVTLLLFDIDDFKSYNDRYGHAAGDEILREVVRLLGSVIRPTDRVCRIGGDEFAVVFDAPDGPRDPASRHPALIVEVARRFQAQIQSHRFPKLGNEAAGGLTISAGLATFPWDASDAQGLTDIADRHLLESKKQGKNRLTLGPSGV